jgi:methylated-DNA-[protein]-cysteine S-methyltransferase
VRKPKCSLLSYAGAQAPIAGRLWLATTEDGLCEIAFDGDERAFVERLDRLWGVYPQPDPAALKEIVRQLHQYLSGRRNSFDLPLDLRLLRPFQRQVLEATLMIPRGQVTTYQALAVQVGRPRSARAVGRAQARNPIPVVIPCHRVIGSDGGLHGYGGGLDMKAALLQLEGVTLL